MKYGEMANSSVAMDLHLPYDAFICIKHSAGVGGNSRFLQWYQLGITVISTWMVPREQGMEFKCMYSVYTGSKMNISICNIWTSGYGGENLLGWNGQPEKIYFWPEFALVPV